MADQILWKFCDEPQIKCTVEKLDKKEPGWTNKIRIYYVLSGPLSIRVGNRFIRLETDQLILINPYDYFAITEEGCTAAVFDLDMSGLYHPSIDPVDLWFDCSSLTADDEEAINVLKQFLARVLKYNESGSENNSLLNISFYYAIMQHLITFFRSAKQDHAGINIHHLERMGAIAKYLDLNYQNTLSLKDTAERFYLSAPYLSKIFNQFFGMSFSDYVAQLRLEKSLPDLAGSSLTIEEVAEKSGFPNPRSYITTFKRKYGMTPGLYRKNTEKPAPASALPEGSMTIPKTNELSVLTQYLEGNVVPGQQPEHGLLVLVELPPCSTDKKGTALVHSFRKIASIGKASDILSASSQSMLRTIQKEIGFEYLLFHGLLDDDMHVFEGRPNGSFDLNFGYIDEVFDFLLSIKLKPFIQLSFMPKDLAAKKRHIMPFSGSVIALPSDMEKWKQLIAGLMLHLNTRYGAKVVSSWPFCLWNLPDSADAAYGLGGVKAYFEFYKETYFTVKEYNSAVQFVSPAVSYDTIADGNFAAKFLAFCREDHCLPDQYQFHFYPIIAGKPDKNALKDGGRPEIPISYSTDPDALKKGIQKVLTKLKRSSIKGSNLYLTEWNSTISHHELLSDTCFQSAYITKNILDNYDSLKSLCYWTLSDTVNHARRTDRPFHGGLGLFTYTGMKKASYQAMRLLSMLGDTKLAGGDGYFVTREGEDIQIIFYNYQHFSDLYAHNEIFSMTDTNRYTPFTNPESRRFSITLEGLSYFRCTITEHILNPKHGSSFDKWIEIGAPLPVDPEAQQYLEAVSVPLIKKTTSTIPNGELNIVCTLEPHEVRLIEIRKLQ